MQVYYVSYLATQMDKCGWCVAIKTKSRDHIESDDVSYQEGDHEEVDEPEEPPQHVQEE